MRHIISVITPLDRPEQPARGFDEAHARFDALLRQDPPAVDPRSRSWLASPGYRTERVVVFLHGLTNSPRQFRSLGERFAAKGYTVLVPRLPYHGYLDRMTTDLAQLRAYELVDATAQAIDIAAGLADHVTVSGISLGGVLAIWAAQYRSVAVAAPIAPALGLPLLPLWATRPAFAAVSRLPNWFMWWDPRRKDRLPGPDYAYPRFPTHALAETQCLGADLFDAAKRRPPRAATVWMITNASDLAVNNSAIRSLVDHWRTAGANAVYTYEFPRKLKLFHDIVDPLQPGARPDVVYPILEDLIAEWKQPSRSS
ncbi:MAG: alpha/beta hydrolase [Chloroflexi bacterium]|nr:alpha/beta hydrolase [Chloroflexota bacterium]